LHNTKAQPSLLIVLQSSPLSQSAGFRRQLFVFVNLLVANRHRVLLQEKLQPTRCRRVRYLR
jgi:hypothetical protein